MKETGGVTVITDGENKPGKGRTLQQWRKSGSNKLCCPAAAQINDTLLFFFFGLILTEDY